MDGYATIGNGDLRFETKVQGRRPLTLCGRSGMPLLGIMQLLHTKKIKLLPKLSPKLGRVS